MKHKVSVRFSSVGFLGPRRDARPNSTARIMVSWDERDDVSTAPQRCIGERADVALSGQGHRRIRCHGEFNEGRSATSGPPPAQIGQSSSVDDHIYWTGGFFDRCSTGCLSRSPVITILEG